MKDDMEYMDCACCEERFHLWCVSEEGEDGPLCKDCGITCDQCDMVILRHDSTHAHTEFVTMCGTKNHTHTQTATLRTHQFTPNLEIHVTNHSSHKAVSRNSPGVADE
jgi:hypothetical protein